MLVKAAEGLYLNINQILSIGLVEQVIGSNIGIPEQHLFKTKINMINGAEYYIDDLDSELKLNDKVREMLCDLYCTEEIFRSQEKEAEKIDEQNRKS